MFEIRPDYVQEWVDIFTPYLVGCHLENAPLEVMEAFEKYKQWGWEQPQ